jgi:hypothetical protein
MSLTATSLVAALPAGFLGYLIVMAYLDGFNEMATVLQVLTGVTLVCCTVAALSPVGILVFAGSGPKTEKPPKKDKKKDKGAAKEDELHEEDALDEAGDEFAGGDLMSDDELDVEDALDESADEMSFDDDFEVTETGGFDDDEFDLEFDDDEKS